jgi:hypothetical protein
MTIQPIWIVSYAPSGHRMQILWDQNSGSYHVSRWVGSRDVAEALGTFPDWEAAVACALGA